MEIYWLEMIDYYVSLLRDPYRIEQFRLAIQEVVQPGDLVAEVGSGLGTFAFFAAEAGAGKVYAIDGGDIRTLLPRLVAENGYEEQIEVIGKLAHQVVLESRVDVLITEDFSNLFLDSALEQLLQWPRRSLLRAGGTIIPAKARLYFAPVDCSRELARHDPWQDPDFGYGLQFDKIREMAVNLIGDATLQPEQLLSDPQLHTEVETATLEVSTFRRRLSFPVLREGRLTALAGWFECDLSPSVTLTNAPGTKSKIWQQGLFLLPPTSVEEGNRVEVEVSLFRDPWLNTFWEWKGSVRTSQGETGFERSSFRSIYLSKDSLQLLSRDYCPPETPTLQADRLVLQQFGTGVSIGEIIDELRRRFPNLFPSTAEASLHIHELLDRYQ